MTLEELATIIEKSQREWDAIHYNGWNRPILALFPTADHFTARKILDAMASAAEMGA